MIRLVRIGKDDEVFPDSDGFAFFDTVRDRFCSFADMQVWQTWQEFEDDFGSDFDKQSCKQYLDRFKSLYEAGRKVE